MSAATRSSSSERLRRMFETRPIVRELLPHIEFDKVYYYAMPVEKGNPRGPFLIKKGIIDIVMGGEIHVKGISVRDREGGFNRAPVGERSERIPLRDRSVYFFEKDPVVNGKYDAAKQMAGGYRRRVTRRRRN